MTATFNIDVPMTGEVRITDPNTGGQKGDKLQKMGAIDPLALMTLSEVAGYGAIKYEAFNYLKGYAWHLSFNAMMRHAFAFWNGEDNDPESGMPHMAHAAWHGLAMTSFLLRGLGTDDRFKQEVPQVDLAELRELFLRGEDGSAPGTGAPKYIDCEGDPWTLNPTTSLYECYELRPRTLGEVVAHFGPLTVPDDNHPITN